MRRRVAGFSSAVDNRQVCQIRAHRFSQTFTETSPGNWVNTAAPEGACGVVRLDRFQIDRGANMGSMTMWNYTSQKALTTPDGVERDDQDERGATIWMRAWRRGRTAGRA